MIFREMKIKRKLLVEILVTYALLILFLTSAVVGVSLISYFRDGKRWQRERDIDFAVHVGDFIRSHYQRTGTLDGLEEALDRFIERRMRVLKREKRSSSYPKESENFRIPKLIVLNAEKTDIVYQTFPYLEGVTPLCDVFGAEAVSEDTLLACVYVGGMIPGVGNRFSVSPAARQTVIILISFSGVLIVFSVVLGILFSVRLSRPLKDLIQAFEQAAGNRFSVRLQNRSNNELGILIDSFNCMMQKLEENEKARRQLTADISHDLRTPLALITARLEMLKEGVYRPDSEQFDFLIQETDRLSAFIDSWRQISRLEAGSLEPRINTKIEINEFLRNLFESFAPMGAADQLSFEFYPSPQPLFVWGDQESLTRAFGNLIMNAVKFSRSGGLIRLSIRREGNEAVSELYDNGIGIPREKLKYIFDRFYKADDSRNRNREGSGLGLAICKTVVCAHGGTVAVDSKEGEYTVFTIRLPLLEKESNRSH